MCSFGVHHSTTLTSKELIPLTRAFHLSLKLKFLLGSSWMARHWWSLQVAPPYTMWEALLCIHLHLYIIINYLMTSFDEHQAHENYHTTRSHVAHDMRLCVDHLRGQSLIFILVNIYLCSMINIYVLKALLISSLCFISSRHNVTPRM